MKLVVVQITWTICKSRGTHEKKMIERKNDIPSGMPTSSIVVAKRISQAIEAHAVPATDRQTDHRSNQIQLSASAGTLSIE